jgi:hypothetical protein
LAFAPSSLILANNYSPLSKALEFVASRKTVITLKQVSKYSLVSTLVFGAILITSAFTEQVAIIKLSGLLYMLFSLVLSVSFFMLTLRHYKITSNNDILIRIIAIVGAMVCCGIWVVLIYPISFLLPWTLTRRSKGQKTVGFCSFVAYFNQLFLAS